MKPKPLVLAGLCIQCAFLVFWLFRAPGLAGGLTVVREEIEGGNPDLPALVVQGPGFGSITVAYDPSKPACENLLARVRARLVAADGECGLLSWPPLILGLLNVVLLAALLGSVRASKEK